MIQVINEISSKKKEIYAYINNEKLEVKQYILYNNGIVLIYLNRADNLTQKYITHIDKVIIEEFDKLFY